MTTKLPPNVVPLNAHMAGDMITILVLVEETDTMDDVARKVAYQTVGRRVREQDAPLVVRHDGTDQPGALTVTAAGISSRSNIYVRYAG